MTAVEAEAVSAIAAVSTANVAAVTATDEVTAKVVAVKPEAVDRGPVVRLRVRLSSASGIRDSLSILGGMLSSHLLLGLAAGRAGSRRCYGLVRRRYTVRPFLLVVLPPSPASCPSRTLNSLFLDKHL